MQVVVTIDVEHGDRPAPDPLGALRRMLEVLDHHGAPASFFVQGRFARAHPDLVASLAERDPTLGTHGYAHVDYRRLTPDGVRAELADGVRALSEAAPGHAVRFARLPHGYGNDEPAVQEALRGASLVSVGWDFSTYDWDDRLTVEGRTARALAALERGGVVLLHSWPPRSPDILAGLLEAAGPGVVCSLDDVELPGRQVSGATMHRERTDLPR